MSRNLRHKSIEAPPNSKKTVRRSSRATDNSSDDDYAGVDLISDEEEDEPDVEEAEEQAIIESAEEDEDEAVRSSPRPAIDDDQTSWDGFGVDSPEEIRILGENVPFFDDHMARMNAPDHDTEGSAWNATNGLSDDAQSPTTKRRVHWADRDKSDSSSGNSDNEDTLFPDIFYDQQKLAPGFRRAIENDDDEQGGSSDEGSYWDYGGSDGGPAAHREGPVAEANKSESDDESTAGSSGYETDEGETTEEDLPHEAQYLPTSSILRRDSQDSSASEDDITPIRRRAPGPKLGSWIHDASKPFAVLDSQGKKLIMFKAKICRRFSFNGTGIRPQLRSYTQDLDAVAAVQFDQMSPMISNSGNMMMSAMFTPLDQFGGRALGPPEAFYPFTSVNADGTIEQDSPSSFDEDDLDDEDLWNVEDFLNFGDESSDDENGIGEGQDPSSDSPGTLEPSSTPARPTTATSEDQFHPLLANSGLVGAFRRNQNRHQLLSRNTATRESLAFSGPFRQGTLRGIKGGRLAAANTPITPMRKQKSMKPIPPIGSSPGSPLAQAQQKKRKFSGEQFGHKRSKSMV